MPLPSLWLPRRGSSGRRVFPSLAMSHAPVSTPPPLPRAGSRAAYARKFHPGHRGFVMWACVSIEFAPMPIREQKKYPAGRPPI